MTLTLRSVTPRITQNTAGAAIKVLLCQRNDSLPPMMSDDLSFRAETKPFAPARLRVDRDDRAGSTTIVLAVAATRPGRVRIDGVHVTCWQGVRYGRQDVGIDMVAEAERPE